MKIMHAMTSGSGPSQTQQASNQVKNGVSMGLQLYLEGAGAQNLL